MAFMVPLVVKNLPESMEKILHKLENQKATVVKGGFARSALLFSLQAKGQKINPERLEIEQRVKDLDLILVHQGKLAEAKAELLDRESEIKKAVSSTLNDHNILLKGEDFEAFQGNLWEERISDKTLESILATRDLTVNEVVLIYEENRWWLIYTQRCWRDLLQGIGFLNNDARLVRMDLGRIVITNRGYFRLLRLLVEGKLEKIWLPQWQLSTHLSEMKRLQDKGEIPVGFTLGRYSLVIASQFMSEDQWVKNRWIKALNYLGFTDLQNFTDFVREQQLLDKMKFPEFQFDAEISFSQIIDNIIAQEEQRKQARKKRQEERNACKHKFSIMICKGCTEKCRIKYCQLCTKYINTNYINTADKQPYCNTIFKMANWTRDPRSLIEARQIFGNNTVETGEKEGEIEEIKKPLHKNAKW